MDGWPGEPANRTWAQQYSSWVPPPARRNELGIASLLFGIFAAVFFWLPVVDLALAVTAVATGFAARRRIKRGEADNNGATVTGIVLGILATVASVLVIVIAVGFFALINDYENCIHHAQGRGEYARC